MKVRSAPAQAVAAQKPVLSVEALAALNAAELAVERAEKTENVWLAALAHLDLARKAAAKFDSVATLQHANETVALCEAALRQLNAPRVTWPRGDTK